MQLLSNSSNVQVHSVPCGWVSQRLFDSKGKEVQFFTLFESVNKKWFDNRYVIIPVNISNCHWILYECALCENVLNICDSMNGNYPNYTSIILRYITLEYFRHSGQSFNYNSWRVCIYANQPDFPIQSNGHSYGPYKCMMAKETAYFQLYYLCLSHELIIIIYLHTTTILFTICIYLRITANVIFINILLH
jgi:hypothetical protein